MASPEDGGRDLGVACAKSPQSITTACGLLRLIGIKVAMV